MDEEEDDHNVCTDWIPNLRSQGGFGLVGGQVGGWDRPSAWVPLDDHLLGAAASCSKWFYIVIQTGAQWTLLPMPTHGDWALQGLLRCHVRYRTPVVCA